MPWRRARKAGDTTWRDGRRNWRQPSIDVDDVGWRGATKHRPLRRPVLDRLAPPRHPRQRRAPVHHHAATRPKSACAGLTLYKVIRELQRGRRSRSLEVADAGPAECAGWRGYRQRLSGKGALPPLRRTACGLPVVDERLWDPDPPIAPGGVRSE